MATETVPVIDITSLEDPATLAELDRACREWGFLQVTNHGVSEALIDDLHTVMQAFFDLPRETKLEIERTRENPWGYYDRELTKNTPDWKQVYDYGPGDGKALEPRWPEPVADFQNTVCDYTQACEGLAFELLGAISTNLGMPQDFLNRDFAQSHSSFLRLNFYPECPEPGCSDGLTPPEDGYFGVNHHTDAGALTILLQDDQPGLQVFREDQWHLVEPRRDALVINIGDMVQVWSNDRYYAALHRVITNTDNARYSAPYFFNPDYRANYAPLPTTVDDEHPARYREINWGEFRSLRADGDYADYGDEVQISDYKIPA